MSGIDGMDALNRRFDALRRGDADRIILGQFGLLAVQYARELVHRKTGNAQRTIRVDEINEQAQTVRIVAGGTRNVGYAATLELGSRAHVIVPRNAKVLAWGGSRRLSGSLRSGSKPTAFAKRVNHPGTKAYPYLRPGAERALREVGLAAAVIQVWNRAA